MIRTILLFQMGSMEREETILSCMYENMPKTPKVKEEFSLKMRDKHDVCTIFFILVNEKVLLLIGK